MYSDKVEKYFLNSANEGILENANAIGCEGNAIYEDQVTIYLYIEGDKIKKVSFQTTGSCACFATASAATELIENRTINEAFLLKEEELLKQLGGLPEEKVYCATLVLDSIKQAICNYEKEIKQADCKLCEGKLIYNENEGE